jgi:hypothetical protein
MITNYSPSLYEINTRVWLRHFDSEEKKATIADVPKSYWDQFVKNKFDYIWLLGVWKTNSDIVDKYCFGEDLKNSYNRTLKDWKREDVIGSPFAIDAYEVSPLIGNLKSLLELKSHLNKNGMKLILDFVPNHFSAGSQLIKKDPDIFLSADKKLFEKDKHTFFKPYENVEQYFAHGRDPFFPAWQDTIQVNIFNGSAKLFLINTLIDLTKVCDGVRCDMAMLALNNVFKNTWGGVLNNNSGNGGSEFWKEAIEKVKNERADFLFIAETYWDLEWELQQLGFDFTYDKKLTDRLKYSSVKDISEHLNAEAEYQKKSIRFIENHDEERAVTFFGKERSKAAAIIISTIPGMRFYYDGQFDGKKIKLPLQLAREPEEQVLEDIKDFYERLFNITSQECFKRGNWQPLKAVQSWDGNETFINCLAWLWIFKKEKRFVVINYSNIIVTCRLKLDVRGYPEQFEIKDLLNDKNYIRSVEEVFHTGLYIELRPYQAHIFSF